MDDTSEYEIIAHLPPAFRDTPLLASASVFAMERHHGQVRKGTSRPYIGHPASVAETLLCYYPDCPSLAAAGLCHDLVEDTKTTVDELQRKFGKTVADLVAGVTAPAGHSPALLEATTLDICRLKGADLLNNASETLWDILEKGPKVW